MAFAHSQNSRGVKHDLEEHLRAVAELAAQYAGKFGAADLGYWAGLRYDPPKSPPGIPGPVSNAPISATKEHPIQSMQNKRCRPRQREDAPSIRLRKRFKSKLCAT